MRSPVVQAVRIRKPWGYGKAAVQKLQRQNTACEIATCLNERLDCENIQVTGELFPRGTLKSRKVKLLFEWVPDYKGRVFTQQLLKIVVRKLMRWIGPIPTNPKMSYGCFVKRQAQRLGQLIRQAKRVKVRVLDCRKVLKSYECII